MISASLFLSQRELNKETRLYQRRRGGGGGSQDATGVPVFVERPPSRTTPLLPRITKKRSSLRKRKVQVRAQAALFSGRLGRAQERPHRLSPLTPRCLRFPPGRGGSDPRAGVRTMHLRVAGFQLSELHPC